MLEKLYKEYQWIKEMFEKDEVQFNISHDLHIVEYLKKGTPNERYEIFIELFMNSLLYGLRFDQKTYLSSHEKCEECGETIYLKFDGKTISDGKRVDLDIELIDCSKINDYSFDINFPSGEVIYLDKLPYLEKIINNKHSLNSKKDLKKQTLNCQEKNICQVFVSNSSPSIYKKDNTIVIGNPDCENEDMLPLTNSKEVGCICTDLWWATLVDKEVYKDLLSVLLNEQEIDKTLKELKTFNIEKGIYRCEVNTHTTYECEPSACTFFSLIKQ